MSKIHIDLTEELESKVKAVFQATCEEITGVMQVFHGALESICQTTGYEPFVNYTNNSLEQLAEEAKANSMKIYDEWREKGSFSQRAQKANAGEQALEIARGIDESVNMGIEEFWNSVSAMQPINVDTSHPKISDESFEELKKIYTDASGEINEIGKQKIAEVKGLSDENPSYEHIIAPIRSIADVVGNNLKAIAGKIKEFKSQSKDISSEQTKIDRDVAQSAVTSAKQTAEFGDMFADLF